MTSKEKERIKDFLSEEERKRIRQGFKKLGETIKEVKQREKMRDTKGESH